MLPSLVLEAPAGDDWIHEIKFDGYRTMLAVDRGETRAFTRNGHDWSDSYPPIVAEAAKLQCQSAVIDGEGVGSAGWRDRVSRDQIRNRAGWPGAGPGRLRPAGPRR
jgi:bifunctional non-homologous end joining protein LigD